LNFGAYLTQNGECQAQLFGRNGNLRVYFKTGKGYYIDNAVLGVTPYLVEEWSRLKDSMHRMIAYGIEECNKANKRKLEEQQKMSDIVDNFRL
jgi:hypothetical protein